MASKQILALLAFLAITSAVEIYNSAPYGYDHGGAGYASVGYPRYAKPAGYGYDGGYKKSAHQYNGYADVHVYQNPKHYEYSVSEKGPGYSKYVRQSAETPTYGYSKY